MKMLVKLNLIILLTVSNFYTLAKECDFTTPEISLHNSIDTNMQLVAQVSEAMTDEDANTVNFNEFKKYDNRKIKTSSSPSYLDAVGKLTITTRNGNSFNCTAYLTSTTPGAASNKLGSAAHCINEYANQKEGNNKTFKIPKEMDIKSITWTTTVDDQTITKNAKILDFDFETDQMLLEIDSKIPFSQIKPLLLENEGRFATSELVYGELASKLIAAGFSSDNYKGQQGKVLTYDDTIDVRRTITQDTASGMDAIPGTVTYSGASGGPLIAQMDLTEEDITNPYDQMYAIGTLYGESGIGQSRNYTDSAKKYGTSRPRFRDYRQLISLYEKFEN